MALKIRKKLYGIRRSIKKNFRLLFGQEYFVKKVNGTILLLDSRNLVDRHVDASGAYEKEQIEKLTSLINKYQCTRFIDVGAHWGLYSLSLCNTPFIQPLDIIAFEPDKINRYQFYANLFLNRIENITLYDYGLSNQKGTTKFLRGKSHNRGANQISDEGNVEIKTICGDDILKFEDEKLAFKIDVEGHEEKTIEGLQKLLHNNSCVLQIECFENAETKLTSLLGADYRYLGAIDKDHYFTNFSD